ncbi:hypothetical protein CIPAW_08G098600 [Carya illinoinensis]|uniref:Uncharacterized protein n=1 Tax=Carya illinoinensis TaxID=32201 RepID=A0A8T1PTF0_CARIL|nr:hypothetical protein CIPAW_08G098600 [Carya illinoinensis]
MLHLLKENGLTTSQISQLVSIQPSLLLSDAKKTLLPKIEFFRSIGFSCSDLPRFLSSNPPLLSRSLEKRLIPCLDFLKSILLEDEKVVSSVKRAPWVIQFDPRKNMIPNIELLRQVGAPQSAIAFLVTNFPSSVLNKHTRFAELVHEVKEMGFNPSKIVFVEAIHAFAKITKSKLESKLELYKRNPTVINFCLEKRIVPICSLIQILLAKGLVKSDLCFLDKFVIKFQDIVPELRNVYLAKMHLSGLGNAVEEGIWNFK